MPHYFEFKTGFFRVVLDKKLRMYLKFEILFFTLRKSQNLRFSRRRIGFAKKNVVNFTSRELYLFSNIFALKPLFKGGFVPYIQSKRYPTL